MKSIQLLSILCLLPLAFSCSTDESSSDKSKQTVRLSVSTPSVSENEGNTELTRSGSEASASQTVTVSAGNGMSLEATLERSPQPVTRATTSLGTGVKYRVIAFKQDDVSTSGYLSYADFTVGTSGSTGGDLHVPSGSTYTFVCYSLGTTTLPAFSESSLNISANPATDDLLYTKFNQSITDSNKTLSFSFKHQFSQVTVIADATSMLYPINSVNVALSINYSATLILADGTLTAGTAAARTVPWGSIGAGQTTVTSTTCTVFTNNSNSVSVSIPSIAIGYSTKTNLTATFGSNTMQAGYKYTLKLVFKPTAISPIVAAGITWAPGNLVKRGSTYTFAPAQEMYSGIWNWGDYWGWCQLDPTILTSYSGSYSTSFDPCQLVAPAATWRMPTSAELQNLVNTGHVGITRNGVSGRSFGTTIVPTMGTEDNYVFLPRPGSRNSGSTTMVNVGTRDVYWSATPNDATSARGLGLSSSNAGIFNGGDRTFGLTIRCVR